MHHRHHTAKDDDQIAFENGYTCEREDRLEEALAWFAEVKPTGGHWDVNASAERIALLVARNRAGEAVQISVAALNRMQQPSLLLIAEAARAWRQHRGAEHALAVFQAWAWVPAIRGNVKYAHDTASYAAQCGQFALSLQGLLEWLPLRHTPNASDILTDLDFAPLWQHLAEGQLTQPEANLLRSPLWPDDREVLTKHGGYFSLESYPHIPTRLRAMLRLDAVSMTWQPRPNTALHLLQAYAGWRKHLRQDHFEKLLIGRRKALAFNAPTNPD
jgi:hypothetical protein